MDNNIHVIGSLRFKTTFSINSSHGWTLELKVLSASYFLGLWCLTPLSTIFQLYRGGRIYLWRKPQYLEKTTDLSQVMLYQVTPCHERD
jgi:hypothetical protein